MNLLHISKVQICSQDVLKCLSFVNYLCNIAIIFLFSFLSLGVLVYCAFFASL